MEASVVFFVVPKQETWCMEVFLQQEGHELAGRLRVVTYDDIAARREIPSGTYIFSAIDQLSSTEREIADLCCSELARTAPEFTILNRPGLVLRRFDFLRKCSELNRNAYQVKRISGLFGRLNFPVFIRNERRHTGSLTRLLHSRAQLSAALAKAIAQGHLPSDLMVVEYRHTADPAGIFREYNAQIVGSRIIPQAVVHSRNWVTKWHGRIVDADKVREEREYLDTNPHLAWLRETFQLANVQFGRMDYGVKDGVPQVWEINTNPMIARPASWPPNDQTPEQRALRAPLRSRFFRELQAAIEAVDTAQDPNRTLRIEVSPRQQRNLQREKRWLHHGKQWDWRTGTFARANER
jgi:hypothetical protein